MTGSVNIQTTGAGVTLNPTAFGMLNLQVGQQMAIINNDGITDPVQGTFKGLPEGVKLSSNFLGSGLTATISYQGLTGNDNDVVLTMSPGSAHPWHNDDKALDVNGGQNNAPDDHIVAGDALAVINYLNAFGSGAVPGNAVLGLPFGFIDADCDNFVTASDALDVIDFLNAGLGGEGEGEEKENADVGVRSTDRHGGAVKSMDNEALIAILAMGVAEAMGRRR